MRLLRRLVGARPAGQAYRHLRPGGYYRVARPFTDHDGRRHAEGQRWRFVTHGFLPYEDGLTLVFVTDRGEDRTIRLQLRPEAEGAIADDLDTLLASCPAPSRTAFAGVETVTADGIVAFDGLRRFPIAWVDIRCVTAAYGRQQYDATRCLTVEHRRGIALFVAETDLCWTPLLDGLERNLLDAIRRSDWYTRLAARPDAAVRVW